MAYKPKVHTVVIVRRGNRAIVWPPYLLATATDFIRFRALGVSAKIEFPLDLAFEADPSPPDYHPTADAPAWTGVENLPGGLEAVVRVAENGDTVVKLAKQDRAVSELSTAGGSFAERAVNLVSGDVQIYAYSVFCLEINDFAEGNSSPVIMIEPPPRDP